MPVRRSKFSNLRFFPLVLIFQFSVLIFLASCSSTKLADANNFSTENKNLYLPAEGEIQWQKNENLDWAEYFYFENKNYPVRYHCVKINLASEKISIATYPKSESDFAHKKSKKTHILKGVTAKKFSESSGAGIVLNTTPFDAPSFLSSRRKICGLVIADKKVLSAPVERYSAILFAKNQDDAGYTAKILKNQKDEDFSRYDFGFGGFFQILSDGKKEDFKVRSNDSRTALALSDDGKTLYLLVVEGERKKHSKGLSFQECSDIFLVLGAKNALQMDGGGSSSLFINGQNFLSYRSLRKNAVFLGFY